MDQCNDVSSTSGGAGVEAAGTSASMNMKQKAEDSLGTRQLTPKPLLPPSSSDAKKMSSGPSKLWKKNELCGVANCGNKSDKLTFATSHVLVYFGIKSRTTILKVCPSCVAKANEYRKNSVEAVKSGRSLFTVKNEPLAVPETIDLENDDAHNAKEEVEVDFEWKDVDGLVKNLLKKINIKNQVDKCTKLVMDETSQLEKDMTELSGTMKSVEDVLYDTCNQYNKIFDRRPQPLVIQEIEISANGSIKKRNMPNDRSALGKLGRKQVIEPKIDHDQLPQLTQEELQDASVSQSSTAVDAAAEFDAMNDSVSEEARKPGPASKTKYYENLMSAPRGPFEKKIQIPAALEKRKPLLPTPSIIPRIKPQVGDFVFAMNKTLLNYWLRAEVRELIENIDTEQLEFIVHYEPTRKGVPTGGIEGDGAVRYIRQLCMKELAYNVPCPFVLPVGTRIIAKFKDELKIDPECDGQYYAGIVAEPPKPSCKNRYLIFFDDGYAQYVNPEGVLLVCESSKDVWSDIHPDSYDFIKDYITRYPEWPMVRLHEGSMVATEWNGKWLIARILEVDSSLAKVRFENDSREEWIYRGSSRFRPIFRRLEKEGQENSVSFIPRHDKSEFKNRNAPDIEYKQNGVSTDKRGARKSTGRFEYYEQMFAGLTSNHINMMDPDLCIEFQGTVTKAKIPDDSPKSRNYVSHVCDSNCVIEYVSSKELKKISPLAIPLFLGWSREIGRAPRHVVFYRAPCGVRVRDYDELNNYLEITQCNISVDHFCFDFSVDCLNEFVPSRALVNIKDISYGKESAPVQCLNSVDFDPLPYMEYISKRIPGPGVDLNTDPGFLECCDCTDNCQDTSKCACWQRTMQGLSFTKLNSEEMPTRGYENRRLKDHIVSGIYECNSSCHCKKTCSNRVVQNGVSWPLQVFKTTKKGWGIRAIHDMPEGTFICIYAGQVLTDQFANEEGKEFGDEYLADLDYIECNEVVKADYESDVTDIEDEDDSGEAGEPKRSRLDRMDEGEDSDGEEDSHANDSSFTPNAVDSGTSRNVAKRKTTGRKKNLDFNFLNNDDDIITARPASHFNPKIQSEGKQKRKRISLRELYGEGVHGESYIMDAKSKGNIGRYLNHSCKPNVFVQNVFVDTHDLRFPMVAFFTNCFVKAGTELTWDYHYQIGSVPGKTMYCFCNTPYCRERLL